MRHNNAIEYELDIAEQQGATAIKKNGNQVDIDGNIVKANRQRKPDAAYTLNGKRYNTNYVSNYELDNTRELNRELQAFLDMCKADPNTQNSLVFQYSEKRLK